MSISYFVISPGGPNSTSPGPYLTLFLWLYETFPGDPTTTAIRILSRFSGIPGIPLLHWGPPTTALQPNRHPQHAVQVTHELHRQIFRHMCWSQHFCKFRVCENKGAWWDWASRHSNAAIMELIFWPMWGSRAIAKSVKVVPRVSWTIKNIIWAAVCRWESVCLCQTGLIQTWPITRFAYYGPRT